MLPGLRASFLDAEAEDERARFRALLREFALLLHAYHESGIFRTHASFVGLLGFAVAVADLRTMWESATAGLPRDAASAASSSRVSPSAAHALSHSLLRASRERSDRSSRRGSKGADSRRRRGSGLRESFEM